ncbi:MAG: tripartite tricarboxylate transporter substrate-binding protein, partial [Xanthobacteraceae bacterium]
MRSAISFRIIALAAAALLLSPFPASAQAWPSRPVTIIVPFPAGGTADLLARGLAPVLSAELGQQFVVDNRTGAGGTIGAAAVARAAPDGYSLLFASGSLAALDKLMFKDLPYDP